MRHRGNSWSIVEHLAKHRRKSWKIMEAHAAVRETSGEIQLKIDNNHWISMHIIMSARVQLGLATSRKNKGVRSSILTPDAVE
jgi:hypothetical protein